jgi:hypothetical protein
MRAILMDPNLVMGHAPIKCEIYTQATFSGYHKGPTKRVRTATTERPSARKSSSDDGDDEFGAAQNMGAEQNMGAHLKL